MNDGMTGAAFGGGMLIVSVIWIVVVLGYYGWYLWSLSKLFPKLGLPSSHGWIPVWNQWQLIQRGDLPGWIVLLAFVPGLGIVTLVVTIMAIHRINSEHDKGVGFTVLGAFLPPVWAMMLANHIGDSAYTQPGQAGAYNGQLPYAVGADGYGQAGSYPAAYGYQSGHQGDPAVGGWQGMPPVQQDPVAGGWHGVPQTQVDPALHQGNPWQPLPAEPPAVASSPEYAQQFDPAWQVAPAEQPQAFEDPYLQQQPAPHPGVQSPPAMQPPAFPQPEQLQSMQPPAAQPPTQPAPAAQPYSGVPGPIEDPALPVPPVAPQPPAPAVPPVTFQEPAFSQQPVHPAQPAAENNWGFSNTTEGAFERLASEGAPQHVDAPLGVSSPPQELYSWPSVEPEPPLEATAVTAAPSAEFAAPTGSVTPMVLPEPAKSDVAPAAEPIAVAPAAETVESVAAIDTPAQPVPAPESEVRTIFETSLPPQGDSSDELDHTVVVSRQTRWGLELPSGEVLELLGDDIVIGRKPQALEGTAALQIADPTRTMSKTHARMRRDGDAWTIEDLNSTNGVAVFDNLGNSTQLEAGQEAVVTDRLIVGTLEVRLRSIA